MVDAVVMDPDMMKKIMEMDYEYVVDDVEETWAGLDENNGLNLESNDCYDSYYSCYYCVIIGHNDLEHSL